MTVAGQKQPKPGARLRTLKHPVKLDSARGGGFGDDGVLLRWITDHEGVGAVAVRDDSFVLLMGCRGNARLLLEHPQDRLDPPELLADRVVVPVKAGATASTASCMLMAVGTAPRSSTVELP